MIFLVARVKTQARFQANGSIEMLEVISLVSLSKRLTMLDYGLGTHEFLYPNSAANYVLVIWPRY